MIQSKSFCGVNLKAISDQKPLVTKEAVTQVLKLFEEGKLKFEKITEMNWEEIAKAHADLENRKTTGKLVLTIDVESK